MTDHTDKELTKRYCNACTTARQSRGAAKRERNEQVATYYRMEIERRGLPVPTEGGVFNGEGSV
jgi:hypothetical protein